MQQLHLWPAVPSLCDLQVTALHARSPLDACFTELRPSLQASLSGQGTALLIDELEGSSISNTRKQAHFLYVCFPFFFFFVPLPFSARSKFDGSDW